MGCFVISVVLIVLVFLCVFDYSVFGVRVIVCVFCRKLVLLSVWRMMLLVLVSSIMFCVWVSCLWSIFIIGNVCVYRCVLWC